MLLADDLAHRRLGGQRHRLVRVAVLEQEGARVLQPVLHGEADVDDVLVLRQHRRIAQAGRLDDRVAADLHRAQLRHGDRLVGLERIREAPLEAGVDGVAVAAERGDDGLLAFLDDEEAAAEPDQRRRRRRSAPAPMPALFMFGLEVRAAAGVAAAVAAARAAALAAEQAAQLAVEVAPQLVEVGRAVAAAVRQMQVGAGRAERAPRPPPRSAGRRASAPMASAAGGRQRTRAIGKAGARLESRGGVSSCA